MRPHLEQRGRPPARHAAVHVRTVHGENLSETFWACRFGHKIAPTAKDSSAPNTYYLLAEYVAIWLLYKLSKAPFSFLGAADWRSYAYFHAGNYAEEMGDLDTAKRLYVQALAVDENLQAASLSLALVAGLDERFLVTDLLRFAATRADRSDATRYHARYVLASRKYDQGDEPAARIHSTQLLRDMAETCSEYHLGACRDTLVEILERLTPGHTVRQKFRDTLMIYLSRWVRSSPKHRELEQYLAYLTPIAEVMLAGLLLQKNPANPAARRTLEMSGRGQSSRVRYNIACVYSILAAAEAGQPGGGDPQTLRQYLKDSLDAFRLALWMDADRGGTALQDRSLAGLRESDVVVEQQKTAAALFRKF